MPVEPDAGRVSVVGEPWPVAQLAGVLKGDERLRELGVRIEIIESGVEIQERDALVVAVFVTDVPSGVLSPYAGRLANRSMGLLLVGEAPANLLETLPKGTMVTIVDADAGRDPLFRAVTALLDRVEMRQKEGRRALSLKRARYELGELVEISRALTQERDLMRLMHLILEKSRFITSADAGSLYVVEVADARAGTKQLRFKVSQNESVEFESSEFTIPITTGSIAGAAVVNRQTINIKDVSLIPDDAPYKFDHSFDAKIGYRTRSVITVPMISAEDEVIGVIQLINKKRSPDRLLLSDRDFERDVVQFDQRAEEVLLSVASQAGIALENALLYDEIRSIFEGFVKASVQAIEQRDPTTSGHSFRVAKLSTNLAQVVDRVDSGVYAASTFTQREIQELEYASLLHDFGKIGVREQVLVKAKKLYPHQLELVRGRFAYAEKELEARMYQEQLRLMGQGAGASDLQLVEDRTQAEIESIRHALRLVIASNEPTVLKEGDFSAITELGSRSFIDPMGQASPLLTPEEVRSLQVTRGSLNTGEMDEIRSHVVHTFSFLDQIPWGKTMSRIPLIAGAHHEKLNGSGYPKGISGEDIPTQARIMTIADIFDALTARDRPYKKSMPTDRALDILGYEVKDGHIDGELVRIFIESKVFEGIE